MQVVKGRCFMPSVAHIIRRRRGRKVRRTETRSRSRLWLLLLAAVLLLALVIPLGTIFGLASYLYALAVDTMPSPAETVYLDPIIGPTELYDRAGSTLLYVVEDPLGDERAWVELDSLPPYVVQATLQMEDPDFLTANVADEAYTTSETLSRLWRYILDVPQSRDTSLVGRLARNALIPAAEGSALDQTLLEIALTTEATRRYDAEALIEWHLNTNYYGNDAYGIEAAAQVYLGKSARDLTLDEAALLAAIPPAPQFNPFDNEVAGRGRQLDLLRTLANGGFITEAAFADATSTQTPLRADSAQEPLVARSFALYARQQAEDILNWSGMDGERLVARGGLRVTTTLDMDTYYQTDCILRAHLAQLNGRPVASVAAQTGEPCAGSNYLAAPGRISTDAAPNAAAIVVQDVATGELHSVVGDVTSYTHQPGPTLHPFVYLQGVLDGDYTPASMVMDIPQPFPGAADGLIYTPRNPDGNFLGPINLRDALVTHRLPPVVEVANRARLNRVLAAAHLMGLNSLDRNSYDLSLLEAGGAVSVLDVAYAYSVFAAQGVQRGVDTDPIGRNYRARNPVAILKIEDAEGNTLWEYDSERRALSLTNVLGADESYLINDMLSDNDLRRSVLGRDTAMLDIGRPAAVVDGLTGDQADSWTVGYTPQLTVAVHLGRDDDAAMSLQPYAMQGSAPIWQATMRYLYERDASQRVTWSRPGGVAEYVVCEKSGLTPPAESDCPTRTEVFLQVRPPYTEDTYWRSVEVNSQTRQLATTYTPTHLRIEQVYFVPPAGSALDWWRSNNLPLPPQDYDTLSRPQALRSVRINTPADFDYIGGTVQVQGSIDAQNFQFYQLAYGQGLNPTQWFEIGGRRTTIDNGTVLGVWDTSGLEGIYTLEVAVTLQDNSRDVYSVQVTIDNTTPIIDLNAGPSGKIYRFPAEAVIPVVATVEDNLRVTRVEFYHNGGLLGVDTDWPYGFEYDIQRAGNEVFRAVVYDEVGNSAAAEIEVPVIRSG